eukprot:scaffold193563_cov29-Tisochrysis_lutea.AAC.4
MQPVESYVQLPSYTVASGRDARAVVGLRLGHIVESGGLRAAYYRELARAIEHCRGGIVIRRKIGMGAEDSTTRYTRYAAGVAWSSCLLKKVEGRRVQAPFNSISASCEEVSRWVEVCRSRVGAPRDGGNATVVIKSRKRAIINGRRMRAALERGIEVERRRDRATANLIFADTRSIARSHRIEVGGRDIAAPAIVARPIVQHCQRVKVSGVRSRATKTRVLAPPGSGRRVAHPTKHLNNVASNGLGAERSKAIGIRCDCRKRSETGERRGQLLGAPAVRRAHDELLVDSQTFAHPVSVSHSCVESPHGTHGMRLEHVSIEAFSSDCPRLLTSCEAIDVSDDTIVASMLDVSDTRTGEPVRESTHTAYCASEAPCVRIGASARGARHLCSIGHQVPIRVQKYRAIHEIAEIQDGAASVLIAAPIVESCTGVVVECYRISASHDEARAVVKFGVGLEIHRLGVRAPRRREDAAAIVDLGEGIVINCRRVSAAPQIRNARPVAECRRRVEVLRGRIGAASVPASARGGNRRERGVVGRRHVHTAQHDWLTTSIVGIRRRIVVWCT